MMGLVVDKVSIEKVLEAVGVTKIVTVDPLDLELAVNTVKEVSGLDGVKAVIFKSPCIAVVSPRSAAGSTRTAVSTAGPASRKSAARPWCWTTAR